MRPFSSLRNKVSEILSGSAEELGRWGKLVRFCLQLGRYCGRRLKEHNALAMSSALSFRTIFAMVPALVLALLVLNSFRVFGDREANLKQILNWAGLTGIAVEREGPQEGEPAAQTAPSTAPADGPGHVRGDGHKVDIASWIERLVASVERKLTLGRIGPVGSLVLIWTALTLLTTLERSLNRIFGARSSRSLARRLMLYWSVVTLGPIFLAAVMYFVRSGIGAMRAASPIGWPMAVLDWLGQFVAGAVMVAAVYKLMPNTRVKLRAALIGAVVVVPAWLIAKSAFGLYLGYIVGAKNLYGALGLLPLFLFWVNLSWLIFLFGAELANTAVSLTDIEARERAEKILLGPEDMLAAVVAVAQPYAAGEGSAGFRQIAAEVNLPDEAVSRVLARLIGDGMICPVESSSAREEEYVPARPIETISVAEIMAVGDTGSARASSRGYGPGVAGAIERARRRAGEAMSGWTLADVISREA